MDSIYKSCVKLNCTRAITNKKEIHCAIIATVEAAKTHNLFLPVDRLQRIRAGQLEQCC